MSELTGDCSSEDVLVSAIMNHAPLSVHKDLSQLSIMLSSVSEVRQRLTSSHMRDLVLIRSSPR